MKKMIRVLYWLLSRHVYQNKMDRKSNFTNLLEDLFLCFCRHCKEDSNDVFPEIKLRGFVPDFPIHTSVGDSYIPRIGPLILLQPNRQTDSGNIKIAHRYVNVKIETEAAQFPFWFFSIFWYSIFAVENLLAKHYSSQVGLEG